MSRSRGCFFRNSYSDTLRIVTAPFPAGLIICTNSIDIFSTCCERSFLTTCMCVTGSCYICNSRPVFGAGLFIINSVGSRITCLTPADADFIISSAFNSSHFYCTWNSRNGNSFAFCIIASPLFAGFIVGTNSIDIFLSTYKRELFTGFMCVAGSCYVCNSNPFFCTRLFVIDSVRSRV